MRVLDGRMDDDEPRLGAKRPLLSEHRRDEQHRNRGGGETHHRCDATGASRTWMGVSAANVTSRPLARMFAYTVRAAP